jgi:hypothetical protein
MAVSAVTARRSRTISLMRGTRDVQRLSQCSRSHAERNQMVFPKDLAGVYRSHSISKHRSFQIIRNFIARVTANTRAPDEGARQR